MTEASAPAAASAPAPAATPPKPPAAPARAPSFSRRFLHWALWLLGVPLLAAGLAVLVFVYEFYPSPPAEDLPPPRDLAAARRQDLDYFAHYLQLDRAYTPRARTRAARLLAQYRAQAGKLSPAQFDLAIARMVALADNGQSQVNLWQLAGRHNRLPCRLYHFADGYRVVRARPACRELLGAELLAVDGHPIESVADRMFEYVGGPRNHYEQQAAEILIESPELLHAAGLADAADRMTLRVRRRDGALRRLVIRADPPEPAAAQEGMGAYADQYLSPARIKAESADWQPLLPVNARLPVFLRDYAAPFRSEYWPAQRVYYMQLRSNDDVPGYPLGDFLDRVRDEIGARQPRFLILDLRLDQGGDLTKTAFFMQSVTRLTGSIEHVYLLTSAWTFSAGETSAALARAQGGSKLTVIGDPVGDRLRFWGEGGSLVLPNSQLAVRYTTGLHDYRRSCFGESGCFWMMHFLTAQVSTLDPDFPVSYTFADYVRRRDPLLQRALELASPAHPRTAARQGSASRRARHAGLRAAALGPDG